MGLLFLVALVPAVLIVWDGLHDEMGRADVAVVLGNKVELDGTPSARLKARLDCAARLFKGGWFPAIIVSGGTGIEGFDEAAVMKRYLVDSGIPAAAIVEDNQGLTTFATAANTARILGERNGDSVLVVSQYFHISRSVLAMQRCGIAEVYSAHAEHFEPRDLYSIPREVIGYARYFVK
jgi:vancomycin permeability regulator SanA